MTICYQAELAGGKHWSLLVSRGTRLKLEDLEGSANVGMLLYNPTNPLERYNAPDTLKCQHTLRLAKGHCLYSDMGQIFCAITEDTVGWHDTIGGTCDRSLVAQRWGSRSYQNARNDWTQDGRSAFLVEAAKYGLGRRDLAANVNWFSKVWASDAGTLTFAEQHSPPGAFVTLHFEMDALVLIHTCPHPLDPSPVYPFRPVRLSLSRAQKASAEELGQSVPAENRRGLQNNRLRQMSLCHHHRGEH